MSIARPQFSSNKGQRAHLQESTSTLQELEHRLSEVQSELDAKQAKVDDLEGRLREALESVSRQGAGCRCLRLGYAVPA